MKLCLEQLPSNINKADHEYGLIRVSFVNFILVWALQATAKMRLGDLSMATRSHINITLMLCLKSWQTSLLYHRSLTISESSDIASKIHPRWLVWLHGPLKLLPSNDITSANLNLRVRTGFKQQLEDTIRY